jgi:hypothetical protein
MTLSGAMSDPLSDPRQRPMDSAECRIKISDNILQVAESNAEQDILTRFCISQNEKFSFYSALVQKDTLYLG